MKTSKLKTAEVIESFKHLPDAACVREPVVGVLWGNISHTTIWRFVKQGRIPAPQKLSPGVTVWRVGHLRRALAEKAA